MQQSYNRGYIALISVILIGALGSAIMISVITQGIVASKTDFSLQRASQARVGATACAEEALQVLLETATSSATGTLTLNGESCTYSLFMQTGSRVINATGYSGSIVRKVKVIVATSTPTIVVTSWQEVSDF